MYELDKEINQELHIQPRETEQSQGFRYFPYLQHEPIVFNMFSKWSLIFIENMFFTTFLCFSLQDLVFHNLSNFVHCFALRAFVFYNLFNFSLILSRDPMCQLVFGSALHFTLDLRPKLMKR